MANESNFNALPLNANEVENLASVDKVLPEFYTLSASDLLLPNDSTLASSLPLFESGFIFQNTITAEMFFPSFKFKGEAGPFIFDVVIPRFSFEGRVDSENKATAPLLELPLFAFDAVAEPPNKFIFPKFVLDSNTVTGSLIDCDGVIPRFDLSGILGADIRVDTTLPRFVLTGGVVLSGQQITVDTTLPRFVLSSAIIHRGNIISGEMILPLFVLSDVTVLHAGQITVDIVLPLFVLDSDSYLSLLDTFNAYSICTQNFGITEYTNYNFHRLILFNGQILGVASDGLYLLEGDDDSGDDINAKVLTGASDFGATRFKRATDLYIAGDLLAQDSLDALIAIDGVETTRSLFRSKTLNETYRAKLPRGLTWRKLQVGFSNNTGADFNVESLEVVIDAQGRKVK